MFCFLRTVQKGTGGPHLPTQLLPGECLGWYSGCSVNLVHLPASTHQYVFVVKGKGYRPGQALRVPGG